jgi:phosphoenolpyruvate carboxykinase (GTP)
MVINREQWVGEVISHEELFLRLYDSLPKELIFTRELILSGLWRSPEDWGLAPEVA